MRHRTRTVEPRALMGLAVLTAVLCAGCVSSPTSHIAEYKAETEALADTLVALIPESEVEDRSHINSDMGVEPNNSRDDKPTDIVWWEWSNDLYFGEDKSAPTEAAAPLDEYLTDDGWTKTPATNADPTLADAFEYRKDDPRGGVWYAKIVNTTSLNNDYVPLVTILIVSPTTMRGDFDPDASDT